MFIVKHSDDYSQEVRILHQFLHRLLDIFRLRQDEIRDGRERSE
jgi:hypothetical protein